MDWEKAGRRAHSGITTDEVKQQVTPVAVILLQAWAKDEQGIHVEADMQDAGVQQDRGDEPPDLSGQNEFIDFFARAAGISYWLLVRSRETY